jgi:hypothetical protein
VTDSLTVSVLLFVALAIGAVVGWDAWRAWRLRRLSVSTTSVDDRRRSARNPVTGSSDELQGQVDAVRTSLDEPSISGSATLNRSEPSLGLDDASPRSGRAEPDLSLPEQVSARGNDAVFESPGRLPLDQGRPIAPDDSPHSPDAALAGLIADSTVTHVELGARDGTGVGRDPAVSLSQAVPQPVELVEPPSPAVPVPSAAPDGAFARPVISERTDCIAVLRFLQPLACERIASVAQSFRRAGGKPVLTEVALTPLPAEALEWHVPRAGQSCSFARFGLLLANRAGPLNALEYTEFAQRVREIASSFGVGVEIADMTLTLSRARELDSESASLDASICLNVDAGEVLGPSQLSALAGPLAIVERGNNRYARLNARGDTLFSVSLGERSNRLGFLLDLPRVDAGANAFAAMLECAKVAARRLPGRLVDDDGRSLSDRALEQIARGIEDRHRALNEAGFAAGSPAALRVFN